MQTITLEITSVKGLKELQILESKNLIKILGDTIQRSPVLVGNPLSLQAFKDWIIESEKTTTISLASAKSSWQNKRQQLVKILK